MFINLLITLYYIPLWIDLIVIFYTVTTILSASITISLCKTKININIDYTEKKIKYEYCMVCSSKLDRPNYPEDFPDKYKLCCFCKETADEVYKVYHNEISNLIDELYRLLPTNIGPDEYLNKTNHYKKYKEKFDNLFIYSKK